MKLEEMSKKDKKDILISWINDIDVDALNDLLIEYCGIESNENINYNNPWRDVSILPEYNKELVIVLYSDVNLQKEYNGIYLIDNTFKIENEVFLYNRINKWKYKN